MTDLTPDTLQLVNQLTTIQADLAALQEVEAALKTRLRELPPGAYTAGGVHRLTVTAPPRRFSPDLAAKVLPGELLTLCTINKIDAGQARKVLPPAAYEQCQAITGGPVIRLA